MIEAGAPSTTAGTTGASAIARVLRRFVRVDRSRAGDGDRCAVCSAPIESGHRHLVDLRARSIGCACSACAILFAGEGAGTFRTIPDRIRHDPALDLEAAALAGIGMPVRLAFAFRHGGLGRVIGLYPGPAGVAEAALDEARWAALAARSPLFDAARPDVEALLFFAEIGAAKAEVFLLGIDRCYALAAAIRRSWRGFEGGAEARTAIAAFVADLRRRSRPLEEWER